MQIHASFSLQPPVSQPGGHEFTVTLSPRLSEAGVGRQVPSGTGAWRRGSDTQTQMDRPTGPCYMNAGSQDGPVWTLEYQHADWQVQRPTNTFLRQRLKGEGAGTQTYKLTH